MFQQPVPNKDAMLMEAADEQVQLPGDRGRPPLIYTPVFALDDRIETFALSFRCFAHGYEKLLLMLVLDDAEPEGWIKDL